MLFVDAGEVLVRLPRLDHRVHAVFKILQVALEEIGDL